MRRANARMDNGDGNTAYTFILQSAFQTEKCEIQKLITITFNNDDDEMLIIGCKKRREEEEEDNTERERERENKKMAQN